MPADATFHRLILAYEEHVWRLATARYGSTALTAGQVVAHCLAALAPAQVITEGLRLTQWTTVRDALQHGATVAQVAGAMALEVDEVTLGLRMCADRQFERGHMIPVDHAALLALLVEGGA